MKLAFFTISVQAPEADAEMLNRFLQSHAVLHVERQFVSDGGNSLWAVCVSYREGGAVGNNPAGGGKNAKVDYKDVLDEAQFAIYAKLRDLRKQLAEREGVPPYALFNNKQLADMVQKKISNKSDLKQIEGIGDGRADKYGELFLQIIHEAENTGTEGERT